MRAPQVDAAGEMEHSAICERERPRLIAVLQRRYGLPLEDAEDVAADAIARAWQYRQTWRDQGLSFAAWLWQIARHGAIDWLRRHRRYASGATLLRGAPLSLDEQADRTRGPARMSRGVREAASDSYFDAWLARHGVAPAPDHAADYLRNAWLPDALAVLTDDQRRCVELRWLEARSIRDTARLMARDGAAVQQLQVRAFARLRQHFAGQGLTSVAAVLA